MATKAKVKLTPATVRKLSAQLARQLGVAWAIVDRKTFKLKTVRPSRASARSGALGYGGAAQVRIVRVDLKIKGLRA